MQEHGIFCVLFVTSLLNLPRSAANRSTHHLLRYCYLPSVLCRSSTRVVPIFELWIKLHVGVSSTSKPLSSQFGACMSEFFVSLFWFLVVIWLVSVIFRMFTAFPHNRTRPRWTLSEIVQCDIIRFIHLALDIIDYGIEGSWYLLRFFFYFFQEDGFIVVVLFMGLLHYLAPWELANPYLAPDQTRTVGYLFSVPGRDEVLLYQVLHTLAINPKTVGVLSLGALMLVPRHRIRRDKIIRWVYQAGLFSTYRETVRFVKVVSWSIIISYILCIAFG